MSTITKASTIQEIRDFILNHEDTVTKYQIVGKGNNKRIGGAWRYHTLFFQVGNYEMRADWATRNSVTTINQPDSKVKIELYKKSENNQYSFFKSI